MTAWDNSVFDAAFDAVGMRERVTPVLGGFDWEPFMARFERPQQVMTDEGIHDTSYSIEYAYRDCPDLQANEEVLIADVKYRVTQPPIRQGDGYYAIALLEEV